MKTKILLISLLVLGFIAFNWYFPFRDYMQDAVEWSQRQGHWGGLFYFFLFVGCVVFFIPVSPLIMMAGTVYGFWPAFLLVSAAGLASVIVTYALGRRMWRKRVEALRHRNQSFEAVFEAISRHGAFLVFLIRLNPLLPYSLLNYLFTIPKLDYRRYLFSSVLGMTPDILFYLYVGSLGKGWLDDSRGLTVWNWVILGAALLTTGIAIFIIRHLIRKAVHPDGEPGIPRPMQIRSAGN
jgi:uncharacterized membrane protein YdjX (TVP38/TMEM64 family)